MKSIVAALAFFVSANAFAVNRQVVVDCNMFSGIDQNAVVYVENNAVLIKELTNSGSMLAPRAVSAAEVQAKQIKLRVSNDLETGLIYLNTQENRWMYKIFAAGNAKRVSAVGYCR